MLLPRALPPTHIKIRVIPYKYPTISPHPLKRSLQVFLFIIYILNTIMAEMELFTSQEAAKQSLVDVYGGVKDHFDGHRSSTELYVLELLRKIHPEFYIVCTTRSQELDLHSFAAAGHAKISRDDNEDVNDMTRCYMGPSSRMDPGPGRLINKCRFARFRCEWNCFEFLTYAVEYLEPCFHSRIKLDFILSPRLPGSTKEGENSSIDKLLMAIGKWGNQLHDEIYVFDESQWIKDKELWNSVKGSSWDDVILDPTMKENLIKDVQGFFDNKQLYKDLAVPWKRGVILHGVPGNGKTISIKALINSLHLRPEPIPSLYVKNFDSCSGEKYSINQIFQKARKMAPCLLIFEDLDSLVQDETRSYFLNEVDGLESNDGILMIGSTNHLDKLDPAISKRPSRFDRKYNFKLPGEAERIAYCHFWRNKLLDNNMIDFPEDLCPIIAKITDGFSFAYLKELFVIVLLTIARAKTEEKMEMEMTTAGKSKVPSEDGNSTDEHVVVEYVDVNSDTTKDSDTATEPPTVHVTTPKQKSRIPEIHVKEGLKHNLLLKIFMEQVSVLLDEMDNTSDEEKNSGDKSQMYRMQMPIRMAQAIPVSNYD